MKGMILTKVVFVAQFLPGTSLYFTGVSIIMSTHCNLSCVQGLKCLSIIVNSVLLYSCSRITSDYYILWFLLSDILSWNDRCVRSQKHAQGGVLHTRTEVRLKLGFFTLPTSCFSLIWQQNCSLTSKTFWSHNGAVPVAFSWRCHTWLWSVISLLRREWKPLD